MPLEIVMPKLGLTMTEGLVVEWKFKEGDTVQKGDILFILETEKVTHEVEAAEDGVLAKIVIPADETVAVGAVVGYVALPGEDPSLLDILAVTPASVQSAAGRADAESTPPLNSSESLSETEAAQPGRRPRATPLAKKMAREYGVDLQTLAGTGRQGRIIAADVTQAHESKNNIEPPATAQPDEADGAKLISFTGMRRAIAKQMLASKVLTAQTYMMLTVDATKIMAYREDLLPYIQDKYNLRITLTDLLMKITAAAILDHPVINTRWTDEGILYLQEVHMGMAMALSEGLIVPVIRDINAKTFSQVARDRLELIRKGRENSFLPDDISGSTFTLSSMGMFGIEEFTSNINLPESAILAVGAIVDKPVARDGRVVIRPMMKLTLSYDHRIIDGAEAGKFMRTLRGLVENPIRINA
ncbi:MAG: 2-oxo acid dehydrogenase subunit E2 [bacterium]|nr:2-oxo acid dehydrogenase subunit E2 [bacterium]